VLVTRSRWPRSTWNGPACGC